MKLLRVDGMNGFAMVGSNPRPFPNGRPPRRPVVCNTGRHNRTRRFHGNSLQSVHVKSYWNGAVRPLLPSPWHQNLRHQNRRRYQSAGRPTQEPLGPVRLNWFLSKSCVRRFCDDVSDHAKVVTREVKENGCRETERVDSIEHPSMTLDERSGIGHAPVTLDRRQRHSASKCHHGDDQ